MVKAILGINLLVFLVYTILITSSSSVADRGFNIAIGIGVCIFIHVVLNVIAAIACFVMGKRESGKLLLICAAVLVPTGFITWLLLLSIYG